MICWNGPETECAVKKDTLIFKEKDKRRVYAFFWRIRSEIWYITYIYGTTGIKIILGSV